MPRQPKPYYRKVQKRWVCTIDGRRITFAVTKQQAMEKYHALMLDRQSVRAELYTVYQLTQSYLDWVRENRKPVTYDKHKHYLKSLIDAIGKTLKRAACQSYDPELCPPGRVCRALIWRP